MTARHYWKRLGQAPDAQNAELVLRLQEARARLEAGLPKEPITDATESATDEPLTFTECVAGYRAWSINEFGELRALTYSSAVWTPGENVATCGRGFDHHAPAAGCGCGLYARFNLEDAVDRPVKDYHEVVVVGSIAAWGAIEVHRAGLRAERAQITALALPAATEGSEKHVRLATRVSGEYGVPLVRLADLEVEAQMHGHHLPKSAIPDRIDSYADLARASARIAELYRQLGITVPIW